MNESHFIAPSSPEEVRTRIERLLAAERDDLELLGALERLARAGPFGGFTWLWGPKLYRRNQAIFRPFILQHFATHMVASPWSTKDVDWAGDAGRALDAWYREVTDARDAELFGALYLWKHRLRDGSGLDEAQWRSDLLSALAGAGSPADHPQLLRMHDLPAELDERTAEALFTLASAASNSFILDHLPSRREGERRLWKGLMTVARRHDQLDFAWAVYRRQVPLADWDRDCTQLAETIEDPVALCAELERRHPEGPQTGLAAVLVRLVERRRADVVPYVRHHLESVFAATASGREGYQRLLTLAEENQWWDLWSRLVRHCATAAEFNREIRQLVDRVEAGDLQTEQRLGMLADTSGEAMVTVDTRPPLDDQTAVRLYECYPALLRGPYTPHIAAAADALPQLLSAALAADDQSLIDLLASRLVTQHTSPAGRCGDAVEIAHELLLHYQRLSENDLARRSVAVLGQVTRFGDYKKSFRSNPLTRFFFAREPSTYLVDERGIGRLLASPEPRIQDLALRVLGLRDAAAARWAAAHIDLLIGTLFRPLPRPVRCSAIRALENAASDAVHARRIHAACREALAVPERNCPQEPLIGLIGRLLHRWPELRTAEEQPRLHGG